MSLVVKDLKHRFHIEPVSEARLKAIERRKNEGPLDVSDLPSHVKDAVESIDEDQDSVLLRASGDSYWLPKPVPSVNYFLLARGYQERMLFKYQCEDFIEIEADDVVVDCGAYVGAFALAACRTTNRVVAIEPTPVNYRCLERNVEGTSIRTLNCGLFNQDGEMRFNIGENSTDNSLISLDDEVQVGSSTAEVLSLATLLQRLEIDCIDYLKVEAEGVELEILEQVKPSTVRKIAVDASEERFGQSPFLDIAVDLAKKGYQLASRNYWLYARAV